MSNLKSIYDVKFNNSNELYWFDEHCLNVSNAEFYKKFPNSKVTEKELNFFRNNILSNYTI